MSDTVKVTSGVPKGSVLGIIIFLIYINDLPNSLSTNVCLLADDAIVNRENKSPQDCLELQNDLNKLIAWEKKWLMEFNPSKCGILSVTRKRAPTAYSYTLHGHTLNRVKSTKYLGLTITSHFKRNVKTRSRLIKTKVYKALVPIRLEFCSTVWDPQSKCATQRLEMVQRRAARYVLRRYHNTSSVSDMVDHLQWPTLAQRRCCYRLTLLYKITHNLVAVPSSQYITPIRQARNLTHWPIYPSVVKQMLFKRQQYPMRTAVSHLANIQQSSIHLSLHNLVGRRYILSPTPCSVTRGSLWSLL